VISSDLLRKLAVKIINKKAGTTDDVPETLNRLQQNIYIRDGTRLKYFP